jgi:hypothetical protein
LLLDPFLKEKKLLFDISGTHMLKLSLFLLHTCPYAFYDSSLVIVLLSQ